MLRCLKGCCWFLHDAAHWLGAGKSGQKLVFYPKMFTRCLTGGGGGARKREWFIFSDLKVPAPYRIGNSHEELRKYTMTSDWIIIFFTLNLITSTGVVLQFCIKKQRNKALFLENKALFLKNKALLRIKVWVNFIYIFQNLLLNHFYCILFSSWVLVFPLTICFII